jgi:hemoglobin
MVTLFEKYGGFSAVSKIVMTYYDKILDSDQVGDYFEDVDMKSLIDHQTKFIASLMGGPASFTNDMLKRVHAELNINRVDFDEVAHLLRDTLIEHNIEDDDIRTILMEIESRSSVIISS